jgi:hypothetical protein
MIGFSTIIILDDESSAGLGVMKFGALFLLLSSYSIYIYIPII